MLIDCDTCVVRHVACDDCVVGVLLGTPTVPGGWGGPGQPGESGEAPARTDAAPAPPDAPLPVEFGPVERRALDVLADHGLIPRLRLVRAPAPGSDRGPAGDGASLTRRPTRDAG